jgi:hypothetical protein
VSAPCDTIVRALPWPWLRLWLWLCASASCRDVGCGGESRSREPERPASASQPQVQGPRVMSLTRKSMQGANDHDNEAPSTCIRYKAQREKIRLWHAQLLAVVYECVTILDNINISVK